MFTTCRTVNCSTEQKRYFTFFYIKHNRIYVIMFYFLSKDVQNETQLSPKYFKLFKSVQYYFNRFYINFLDFK